MLIPEYGASKLMYIAIMTPANRPVNRARRGVLEKRKRSLGLRKDK